MAVTAPIDPAGATVTRGRDGSVRFARPDAPWTVSLWAGLDGGRLRVDALRVDVRDHTCPVTPGRLAAVPVAHLLHVAGTHLAEADAPNEVLYRLLAVPKPAGQRRWDDDHWRRVLDVYRWGRHTHRPGGGAQAVADMWNVARDPTANRWLAEARRRLGKEPTPWGWT